MASGVAKFTVRFLSLLLLLGVVYVIHSLLNSELSHPDPSIVVTPAALSAEERDYEIEKLKKEVQGFDNCLFVSTKFTKVVFHLQFIP